MRRTRRGFTLVEMLTVIGILMILLALTIGAVLKTPRVNALVGTEQMVGDLVRQARHTARSSGAPVVIEIDHGQREVMGVSQLPLWTDAFEDGGVWASWQTPAGRSGMGVTVTSATPPYPERRALTREQRLARTATGTRLAEGFYLSCAIRLPLTPATPPPTDPPPSIPMAYIPLVVVGEDSPTGELQSTATCGLILASTYRRIQNVAILHPASPTPPQPPPPKAHYPYVACWDVYGWVNSASGGYVDIDWLGALRAPKANGTPDSDACDAASNPLALQNLDTTGGNAGTPAVDVQGPISGGAWEELGLLYDGQHLELYHNGQLIAVCDASMVGALKQPAGAPAIHLGHAHLDKSSPATPEWQLQGVLDDVRLYRLGIDRAANLPSGVTPQADYRLTAHPDGRVEVSQYDPSTGALQPPPTTKLLFTLPGTGAADTAEIDVGSDGQVSSTVLTP